MLIRDYADYARVALYAKTHDRIKFRIKRHDWPKLNIIYSIRPDHLHTIDWTKVE